MVKPVTIEEAKGFLVAELKAALEERGASADGKKSVLLARLMKLIKSESTVAKTEIMDDVAPAAVTSLVGKAATAAISSLAFKPVTIEEAKAFLVPALKAALDDRGASVEGNKSVLLARLIKMIKAEPAVDRDGEAMEGVVPVATSKSSLAKAGARAPVVAPVSSKLDGEDGGAHIQVEVPKYWGSILESVSSPGAKYEEVYGSKTRIHSMAMIMEPFLTSFCRRSGAFSIKSDTFDAMRAALANYLSMVSQSVFAGQAYTDANSGMEITFEDVKKACKSIGISILGSEECFYSAELDATVIGNGFVDAMTEREKLAGNDPVAKAIGHWIAFCKALETPAPDVILRRTVYTILNISKLVGEKRASPVSAIASGGGQLNIVSSICSKFDGAWVPLRNILSFLGAGYKQETVHRKKVIFQMDNMDDNWDGDVCYSTLQAALDDNINVKKAEDEHTGITLLHSLAIANDGDGSRKLIEELGFKNVDVSTGSGFENGDGWGEEEYNSFTPLNFACANGSYEVAKVLLRNGADATHKSGWDGCYHVPVIMQGHDYWYTGGNTPLHQAARGNHADIIHLLLSGPDKESQSYADSKGINLTPTWGGLDLHDSSPRIEIYNSKDEVENLKLTPLGMALIFGNIEAAEALLQYGANLDNFGSTRGIARPHVMRQVWKHSAKFKEYIENNLDDVFSGNADARQAFESFMAVDPDDDEEEEEEEDPWEKEDWKMTAVPAGDARVPSSEDEEDGDEDEAGFLSSDQCFFITGIKAAFQSVHPSLQMSRNLQIIYSDCCEMFVGNLMTLQSNTGVSILNAESVVKALPAVLPSEFVSYAVKEVEKGKDKDQGDVEFFSPLSSFLEKHYGDSITLESDGIMALALLLEYITMEIMELSGNSARDQHLEMLAPHNIVNLRDEGLDPLFDYCVAGTALRVPNIFENGLASAFITYALSDAKKDDESLHPSWAAAAGSNDDLSKNSIASEGMLMIREVRHGANSANGNYGKPIFSVKAFAPLLEQVVAGRQGLVFSPKAALAVQYCCEMLMSVTMTKAATTANNRSAEKYSAFCSENDREHAEELSGTSLDLCAADVQAALEEVVQNLQDICSVTYFKEKKTEEDK